MAVVLIVSARAAPPSTGDAPHSLARKHGLPCDAFSDSAVNLNATIAA